MLNPNKRIDVVERSFCMPVDVPQTQQAAERKSIAAGVKTGAPSPQNKSVRMCRCDQAISVANWSWIWVYVCSVQLKIALPSSVYSQQSAPTWVSSVYHPPLS